jgi:3D-(3,5/4)-trihydroxycyclohexane-1,2-dione acylhydrolase (decyclizing)
VLVDNHGYGCIHGLQRGCGGNSFGNEFRLRTHKSARLEGQFTPVDFVKNAESLGASAVRANNADELRAALADAKNAKGVRVIYVEVPADVRLPGYSWWDVPMSATSKVPAVRAARAAYDRAIKKQRFHY